jgi:hypothetical protein
MNKAISIILHLQCILRKAIAGKDWDWHWQHILREFGVGKYSVMH